MPKRCQLTGKTSKAGRRVSHSNVKTPRRFQPNLQRAHLQSNALRRSISLRICTRALRSVQKHGGLDNFLIHSDDARLAPEALRLKRLVQKALH